MPTDCTTAERRNKLSSLANTSTLLVILGSSNWSLDIEKWHLGYSCHKWETLLWYFGMFQPSSDKTRLNWSLVENPSKGGGILIAVYGRVLYVDYFL